MQQTQQRQQQHLPLRLPQNLQQQRQMQQPLQQQQQVQQQQNQSNLPQQDIKQSNQQQSQGIQQQRAPMLSPPPLAVRSPGPRKKNPKSAESSPSSSPSQPSQVFIISNIRQPQTRPRFQSPQQNVQTAQVNKQNIKDMENPFGGDNSNQQVRLTNQSPNILRLMQPHQQQQQQQQSNVEHQQQQSQQVQQQQQIKLPNMPGKKIQNLRSSK